jgi:hypothetical protein
METEKRELLFRLAADGDVEAIKEVALDINRMGLSDVRGTGINVTCDRGCGVLIKKEREETTCNCGRRYTISVSVKRPKYKPQDYGGVLEKDETHNKQCYECKWWFIPSGLESHLEDYHHNFYEDFCQACVKEYNKIQ